MKKILDNKLLETNYDDWKVSSLIDEAARSGKRMSIDQAFEILDNNFQSHQEKRLEAIEEIYASFRLPLNDEKDSKLNEYHFEMQRCGFKYEAPLLASYAQSFVKKSPLDKGFVLIVGEPENGVLYYFEKNAIIDCAPLDWILYKNVSRYIDYLAGTYPYVNSLHWPTELIELKISIISFFYNTYESLLCHASGLPNNRKIIEYYLEKGGNSKNLKKLLPKLLALMINSGSFSNVLAVSCDNLSDKIRNILSNSKFNPSVLLGDGKINTSHPLIDTFSHLLFENRLRGFEYRDYFSCFDSHIPNYSMLEREIIAINLIEIFLEKNYIAHREIVFPFLKAVLTHPVLRESSDFYLKFLDRNEILLNRIFKLFSGKLNSSDQIIDIFQPVLEKHCQKYQNYMQTIPKDRPRHIHGKREIAAIRLIEMYLYKNPYYQKSTDNIDRKTIYNHLVTGLNKFSIKKNSSFCNDFFKNNEEIFDYVSVQNLKFLLFYKDFFKNPEYVENDYRAFKNLLDHNLLNHWFKSVSFKAVLTLQGYIYLQSIPDTPEVFSLFKKQVFNEINDCLPAGTYIDLITQYVVPSIFEQLSARIEQYTKKLYSIEKYYRPTLLPVNQQDQKSSDCGYWSLFNVFKMISELPFSPSSYFKESACQQKRIHFTDEFKEFKIYMQSILSPPFADLSAIDLANAFDHASGDQSKLSLFFPELHKKLQDWQDSTGIPAYTIINTAWSNSEEKSIQKNQTKLFGGCLPILKMQIAINLFRLAQLKGQKLLHFFLIGTEEHWHVQLLAAEYYKKNYLHYFQLDSRNTSGTVTKSICEFLDNLLSSPEEYIKTTASELIGPMHADLRKLSKATSSSLEFGDHELEIQQHTQLLINFFSAFKTLPWVDIYLPTLKLAKKITYALKKDYPEFSEIHQQLTDLYSSMLPKVSTTKNKNPFYLFNGQKTQRRESFNPMNLESSLKIG